MGIHYIPKETAQELVCCDKYDGYEVVRDELVDTSRWHNIHDFVIKIEDEKNQTRYYRTSYRVGATEYQPETPFEDDSDPVRFYEVEPYEKTVIEYRKIKDGV